MKHKKYYNISERKILLKIVDSITIILSLFFSFKFLEFDYFNFENKKILSWILLLIVYYLIFGEIFQLFHLGTSNNRYLSLRALLVTALTTTVFYFFTPFLSPEMPGNRLQIIYLFLTLVIPVLIWRFFYIQVIFSPKYFKRIIFIGSSNKIEKMVGLIKGNNYHYLIAYFSDKSIDDLKGFKDVNTEKLSVFSEDNMINEIIVSKEGLSEEAISSLNKELIYLFQKGFSIRSFENFYESTALRVPKEYLERNFYKYINFTKNNTNRFYLFGLRIMDILVSFFGLILFLLIIPFLLIGNLFGNKGPFIYSQKRVGKNGNFFEIYKLRSMIVNAEKKGVVWAQKNDVRITPFGKFLRNTRLDEVPQFFNILKGDMSIIGPRPERPKFVKELEDKIPFYAIRHTIRPGLTGWAQVNYSYANTIEEQEIKLRYDLYYIKKRDTMLDLKILIKTITTVLFYRGQ
jgi:exopolysaccharide biosynthesis polyprenyl glycosylphosphotransferase